MTKPVVHTRLSESDRKKIEQLAVRFKTDVSTVMRWAAEAIIDHVDKHGGKVTLPIVFDKVGKGGKQQRSKKNRSNKEKTSSKASKLINLPAEDIENPKKKQAEAEKEQYRSKMSGDQTCLES